MQIFQKPNPPFLIALFGFVLSYMPVIWIHKVGASIYTISIIVWAYLELTKGINLFRKVLGAVVLAWTAYSLFNTL